MLDDFDDPPRRGRGRPRKSPFNTKPFKSPRSTARDNEHTYRMVGPAKPLTRALSEAEIHVGMLVLARGKPGTVEAIVRSVATQSNIYVVAHDPRMRLPYRASELTAAPNP